MGNKQTTEIAFLRAENDKLRRLLLQHHAVLEWNSSIAAAFAFDVAQAIGAESADALFARMTDAQTEARKQVAA